MHIVVLALEPSLAQMLREVLELEGYAVTVVRHAAEAIQPIEDHPDASFILLADNIHANPHAQDALEILAHHPELRRRTRFIAVCISSLVPGLEQAFPALVDDFLLLPVNFNHLLACIETNVAKLPE